MPSATTPLNFQQIRREAKLTSQQVANQANLPLRIEYLYEIGASVEQVQKEKLVAALAVLTKHPYTLQHFESHTVVSVLKSPPPVARVYRPLQRHGGRGAS